MKNLNFSFELLAHSGKSRLGKISTKRGLINTPAFMPVGTLATIKGVFVDDVKLTGTEIILGNTYHLMIRPGTEIIEKFKPITSRIAEKRRNAPNFDKELLMSEIEIGERGILDLIRTYDPDSGVPLAAYINQNLPKRAIEASRRVLGEEFTADVTEARTVTAEETADVDVTPRPKRKKIVLSE